MNNVLKLDPTRTTTLRRSFMLAIRRRIAKVRRANYDLIVKEDAFGIKAKRFLQFNEFVINTRWQFLSDADKLGEYQKWLRTRLDTDVLSAVGGVTSQPWTAEYIDSAYKRGLVNSYTEVHKEDLTKPFGFGQGTKSEFLRDSFAGGVSQERLKLLNTRVFTELKGVTDTMSQQMSRVLSDGFANGLAPGAIARDMSKTIDGITRKRANTIARTEIVHAYNEAQLDGYEKLNVDDVGVVAEWSTAGDDLVCPLCLPLEGLVLKIKEARGMIPRHPNCVSADSLVHAPDSLAVMKAEYTGQVFEFLTSLGGRFTVTPNHILLTQRGWSFAKDITDRDYFVNSPFVNRLSITPDNDLTHPTIGQVFSSLEKVVTESAVTETLAMPEYFHGDGKRIESKIKVINMDSELRNGLDSRILAEFEEQMFISADVVATQPDLFNGLSSADLFRCWLATTTDCIMGSLGIADILKARSVLHHQLISLPIVTQHDSLVDEQVSDCSPIQLKLLAKPNDAFPSEVEYHQFIKANLAEITSIHNCHVTNLPVYDVSTESSLYTVAGVLSSNCRCAWIPAFDDIKEGGQKRSKAEKQGVIDESIAAGKRKKESLASAKKRTSWIGADKKPVTIPAGTSLTQETIGTTAIPPKILDKAIVKDLKAISKGPNKNLEHGVWLTPSGRNLVGIKRGTSEAVSISDDLLEQARGGTFYHSHSGPLNLSASDIAYAQEYDLSVVAVGPDNGVYKVSNIAKGYSKSELQSKLLVQPDIENIPWEVLKDTDLVLRHYQYQELDRLGVLTYESIRGEALVSQVEKLSGGMKTSLRAKVRKAYKEQGFVSLKAAGTKKVIDKVVKATKKKVVKAAKKTAKSKVPGHITYSGEETKFNKKIWAIIGDGYVDEEEVKKVGKLIRQEVNRRLTGSKTVSWRKLRSELQEKSNKLYTEAWIANRSKGQLKTLPDVKTSPEFAEWRKIDAQRKAGEATQKALNEGTLFREILGEVRDMGGAELNLSSSTPELMKSRLNAGAKRLPKDWIDRVRTTTWTGLKTDRGYFDEFAKEIALSGRLKKSQVATAVHELTHASSYKTKGMLEMELKFRARRVKGFTREVIDAGPPREVGWKDEFNHIYTGRDYGRSRFGTEFTEILSTGVEDILGGESFGRYIKATDTDFMDFVLGALAGF